AHARREAGRGMAARELPAERGERETADGRERTERDRREERQAEDDAEDREARAAERVGHLAEIERAAPRALGEILEGGDERCVVGHLGAFHALGVALGSIPR